MGKMIYRAFKELFPIEISKNIQAEPLGLRPKRDEKESLCHLLSCLSQHQLSMMLLTANEKKKKGSERQEDQPFTSGVSSSHQLLLTLCLSGVKDLKKCCLYYCLQLKLLSPYASIIHSNSRTATALIDVCFNVFCSVKTVKILTETGK